MDPFFSLSLYQVLRLTGLMLSLNMCHIILQNVNNANRYSEKNTLCSEFEAHKIDLIITADRIKIM